MPDETYFLGRSIWVSLLSEVLPRALLAELGLAKILLGSSGGGQFLAVLPGESRQQAEEFLAAAARGMEELSAGRLTLLWAVTENLGDWSDVRRRLAEAMQRKRGSPAAAASPGWFEPQPAEVSSDHGAYFSQLAIDLRDADSVGWSPEDPARITLGSHKHTWNLSAAHDGIPLARHSAPSDDAATVADLVTLGRRAEGHPSWGVLRGDVDNFGVRIRRAQTIEECVQLSVMYKQFFAGELEVLCSMPEFWRRVTILYSGGDDFAILGAWDALIPLAREVQRLFHRFAEENLRDLPGPEGKTITMALALAPELATPLASVYSDAGRKLELAKSSDKDCFYLLGRTLEWKQVADAAEIRDTMAQIVRECGGSTRLLWELGSFYKDTPHTAATPKPARGRESDFTRPWRLHGRVNRVLGATRDRELQKLRSSLISELIGRSAAQWRLRPSGRVALEWAKLSTEE